LFVLPLLLFASAAPAALAQAKPLITARVDDANRISLKGSVSPKLKGAQDLGQADASQAAGRLQLILQRSPEQESALQEFLQQAHQPSSPNFHKWLTPASFAQQFGAADSDIEQLTGWLQAHGLTVAKVSAGKSAIEFTGTVGQVETAFHTSIHTYTVKGETHHANATAPQIPAAFSSLVAGVSQLNDFKPVSQAKLAGQALYNPKTHQGQPAANWTYPAGYYTATAPFYFLAPEDVSKQYDIAPAYAAGLNGAGQTIGIINDSNIDLSLVNAYRKLFNLPANPPQVIVDGNDPGINGDAIEAYLDVENAGAIAPNATVKLYISGSFGLMGDGGLLYSIQRAVNDDAASVLSLSFGLCEFELTQAEDYELSSLWEQAAAQGQTVFVSTGDTGSFGCNGLGVNGFASTPWNIGVGGTDIYLADYASGGASIASFWSNTNDANLGSLQKTFPEQPWNGSQFGLNSTTYTPPGSNTGLVEGGGGGASSCAQNTFDPTTYTGTCIAGWPKPAYQTGTGVPADGVRDVPDVSLFASNGFNGVIWPICSEAGDCTETNPFVDAPYVSGVGGTSASAPAMAAIMALVDQKYGPQGQANYVLYPLAAQFPAVFNDVSVGSNNVPCGSYDVGYFTGCSKDTNDAFYSYQNYAATSGYDLASGLGSVDVNQLLTDWSKIAFKPSATALTLSPTTLTHGATVTATATVSGTGTPAGAVALVSSTTLPNNKGGASAQTGGNTIQLVGGTGTETLTSLPGGTYTVTGSYSGDGINAPSTSSPVTVTVNPEVSTLAFTPQYYDPNLFQPTPIANKMQVPYNSAILMDIQIEGAAGTIDGNPTGSVTFTNTTTSGTTTTLAVVAVSAGGTAEFDADNLPPGNYSIGASYSGDASYKPSTVAPVSFSIVQSPTQGFFLPDNTTTYNADGSYGYQAGESTNIEAFLFPNVANGGLCPTGNVTFQLGSGTPVTSPLAACENFSFFGYASVANDLLTNLQAGTYTLTATYPGDANYTPITLTQVIEVVPTTLLPSTTTVSISPSLANINPSTVVTITISVAGNGTIAPTGTVSFALGNLLSSASDYTLAPAANGTATAVLVLRAADLLKGPNAMVVTYAGDKNYLPSAASVQVIPDDPTDFTLAALTPNVVIPSGATGTGTVTLGSLNGFAGSISLTCTAPAALICTLPASSVPLAAAGSATATVNLNTVTAVSATGRNVPSAFSWKSTAAPVFAAMLFLLLPNRKRFGRVLFMLFFCVLLGAVAGCSKSEHVTQEPVITYQNAAPGSYSVVVTGTAANGIVHNQNITVIVQ
jgi:subtilase family serine protease